MTTETQEQVLEVRQLHGGDVLTLAKLMAKIGMDAKEQLKEINERFAPAIKAANKGLNEAQLQTYDSEEEKAAAIEKAEAVQKAELDAIYSDRGQEIALSVLLLALEKAEDYLKDFMADLVGKNAGDFNQLGFSAPIDIIYELAQREDFKDFFEKAQKLAKIFMK